MADHYGDFMGSMGNMEFEDPDIYTGGFVERVIDGPSRSGMGGPTRPFTMGMRPQQERMNKRVQIDSHKPMETFVHEMTHATDIHNNPGTIAYLDERRKRLNMDQGADELARIMKSSRKRAKKLC